MYKRRRFTHGRGDRGKRQGGFRMKTFDPSRIIKNAPTFKQEVHELKHKFSDFAISERLKVSIERRGYTNPTPIQDQAIPLILQKRDVVGTANTGTGKTAAFLIPLINKITQDNRQKVLVIAPTRELAVQIEDELSIFARNLGITAVVCIGGVPINRQIGKLRQAPQFVIGTPGRLLDLSKQRKLNFNDFGSVVLDEVDRMLDMGFIKDINKIISQLPQNRQSLFFSATVGADVMKIMGQFTKNPVTVSVKQRDIVINVDQEIVRYGRRDKLDVLQDLLTQRGFDKVLVFSRTKRGAERLARDLTKRKFRASAIHGNKSQNQRQRALDQFKRGNINILVATDVVARGIDVNNITHVINYDLPESEDHYIHRIGRTGRAEKRGKALTFVA